MPICFGMRVIDLTHPLNPFFGLKILLGVCLSIAFIFMKLGNHNVVKLDKNYLKLMSLVVIVKGEASGSFASRLDCTSIIA